MSLSAPVVLFVFNRAATTRRVFEAIRQARPWRLFVFADGPRDDAPDEGGRCADARRATETVDWPCDVVRDYARTNLGIRRNVERGLAHAFSAVDRAIVLEDDCLPDATFFEYCDDLLHYFADDPRVMTIGGSRPANTPALPASYALSRYPLIWGWATWRRAWQYYDGTMAAWPEVQARGSLRHILGDARAEQYWSYILNTNWEEGDRRNWDYSWVLSSWLHDGLSVVPDRNLVSNIGFGTDGTHCTDPLMAGANLAVSPMPFPLRHPAVAERDAALDAALESQLFSGTLTRVFSEARRRIAQAAST